MMQRHPNRMLQALAVILLPSGASGQEITQIVGDSTYCDCTVPLEHVVEGPGMLPWEIREVRRNSEGVYHVLPWREHRILRFAADGTALAPMVPEGQGPGEAREVESFVIVADSVIRFDFENARMTVSTVPDDPGLLWVRHVAEMADGVWTAPFNQYTLERWSLDGRRVQAIERVADWFQPRFAESWGGPDEPLKPVSTDLSVDRRGYICTIIRRGGPRWALVYGGDGASRCWASPESHAETSLIFPSDDTKGPGMLPWEIREVRRSSEGVYHVLPWRDHRILRFTSDGKALAPMIPLGQGPGEALGIESFIMVEDSVMTFDERNARMTVFGPDAQTVRTVPVSGWVNDAAYFPDAGILLNTRGTGPSTFGLPLHFLNFRGEHVRSFGGAGMVRIDAGLMWVRQMAQVGDGVWTAPRNYYTLEHWSVDGRRIQTIERVTDWFEPRLTESWGGPDEPLKPRIMDVWVDGRGYVSTIIQRGGPRWAELLPPRPPGALAEQALPGIGLFESIVEIIDPSSGRLVARGILEPELYGFVDSDHAFSHVEDALGNPTISIWRLRLSGLPPRDSSFSSREEAR